MLFTDIQPVFTALELIFITVVGKVDYSRFKTMRLTMYIPLYLTAFKISLLFLLYIYKASLLKLS
jgi:hypothetical protein